jgi:ABC-type taurine transport system substrate-binding protein
MHAAKQLAARSIDLTFMGSVPFAYAVALGADFIALSEQLVRETLVARALSRDGTPLQSPADLDGAVVAAVHASTAHYNLFVVEEIFGITFKEVVEVQSLEQVQALWSRGAIDAAFCWEPCISQLLSHADSRALITSDQLRGWERLALDLFVGRRDDAAALRPVVEHILGVIQTLNQMWMNVEVNSLAYIDADTAPCAAAGEDMWDEDEPGGYLSSIADAVNVSADVPCEVHCHIRRVVPLLAPTRAIAPRHTQ